MITRRFAFLGTALLTALPFLALAKGKRDLTTPADTNGYSVGEVTRRPAIRFSVNPEDEQGYGMWKKYRSDYHIEVYVDGELIRGASTSVQYYDDGTGYVISATYDENGDIVYVKGDEVLQKSKVVHADGTITVVAQGNEGYFPETRHVGQVRHVLRPKAKHERGGFWDWKFEEYAAPYEVGYVYKPDTPLPDFKFREIK